MRLPLISGLFNPYPPFLCCPLALGAFCRVCRTCINDQVPHSITLQELIALLFSAAVPRNAEQFLPQLLTAGPDVLLAFFLVTVAGLLLALCNLLMSLNMSVTMVSSFTASDICWVVFCAPYMSWTCDSFSLQGGGSGIIVCSG